jgi:hypothetical protein
MSKFESPFIIVKSERLSETDYHQGCIYVRKQAPKKLWTPSEKKQYVRFFEENPEFLEASSELRKRIKFFNLMHGYITTRTANQIKSHHQKLMQRYGKIETVVSVTK